MRIDSDKIDEDLQVQEELIIHGMITGNVTVLSGGHLILHGVVCKNMYIEKGASADIHGVVLKDVYNRGILAIFGTIKGHLHNEDGTTYFGPKAGYENRLVTKQLNKELNW